MTLLLAKAEDVRLVRDRSGRYVVHNLNRRIVLDTQTARDLFEQATGRRKKSRLLDLIRGVL